MSLFQMWNDGVDSTVDSGLRSKWYAQPTDALDYVVWQEAVSENGYRWKHIDNFILLELGASCGVITSLDGLNIIAGPAPKHEIDQILRLL